MMGTLLVKEPWIRGGTELKCGNEALVDLAL